MSLRSPGRAGAVAALLPASATAGEAPLRRGIPEGRATPGRGPSAGAVAASTPIPWGDRGPLFDGTSRERPRHAGRGARLPRTPAGRGLDPLWEEPEKAATGALLAD